MRKEMVFDRITKEDVGFGLVEEAENFVRDLRESPLQKREILENTARQIRTYESETLEDSVVSYYPCFVHSVNGKTKLFSTDNPHEKFLIEKQIDSLEREGSVKAGFSLLQEKIGETEGDNKLFLWISPKGSAGTRGIYKDINYKYHQIYIGEVHGNRTEAYALKSDIDEDLLAEWVNQLSEGETKIVNGEANEFLYSPAVISLPAGLDGISLSLLRLKQILEQENVENIYKTILIKGLTDRIRQEKIKQEQDTRRISRRLGENIPTDRDLGYEEARRALGGELYVVYNKYANTDGEITLTGCAGGNITINNFLYKSNPFGSSVPKNIYSTKFRIESQTGENDNNYTFDNEGTCRGCNKSSDEVGKLGPCFVCRQCDKNPRKSAV